MDAGRNQPCPCGSGKKFKRCCGQGGARSGFDVPRLLREASEHHLAGRLFEAEMGYREVLRGQSGQADAEHGLGVIAYQQGDVNGALQRFDAAIAVRPHNALFHYNRAKACRDLGDVARAEDAYRQALKLDPAYIPALENLGNLYAQTERWAEAADCYRQAAARQPGSVRALRALGWVLWRAGALREAHRIYRGISGDPIARLRRAMMGAAELDSRAQIAAARAELAATIRALHESAWRCADPATEVALTPFYLAYHGEDDRPLLAELASLYLSACPELGYVAPHCKDPAARAPAARIRIGFISAFFRDHAVSKYMRGFIEGLDRSRFEVLVLGPSHPEDAYERAIRRAAERYVVLEPELARMREQIAAEELDVALFTDIGMHPLSYFLAFARLAPLQCTTYGHPVTSGIPAIDYFLSHAGVETDGAEAHYTEHLALLPPGTMFADLWSPTFETQGLARDGLGLDAEDHLYLCTQALQKLHPDFDALLEGILARDPRARVVLVAGQGDWPEQLRSRWTAVLSSHHVARICFVPFQRSPGGYYDLYRMADVVLDTPHFSGGNTSLEALGLGVPVVTLPGAFFRGRQTLAMYRQMDMEDCVARDADDYVDIAVRLATDAAFSGRVRARIAERRSRLFGDRRVVADFSDLLAALHHKHLSRRDRPAQTDGNQP